MRSDIHDLTVQGNCPLRAGPCLAGFAFMERLGQCCQLAGRVTGAMPELTGAVTLKTCTTDSACALDWQVQAGVLELSRAGRVLLRGGVARRAAQ